MIVSKISIKNRKTSLLDKIINFLMIPILILILIGSLIFIMFLFIKEKVLKIKNENKQLENVENILFENDNFKIIQNFIGMEEETEENKTLLEFHYKIFEHSENYTLSQLEDKKQTTDLGKCYITDFKLHTNTSIYLQQLIEENGKIRTFLIRFDKETGKTEVIHEIGDFILDNFDKKKNIINGFSNNKEINLQVEF